jgi:hypothetical protein
MTTITRKDLLEIFHRHKKGDPDYLPSEWWEEKVLERFGYEDINQALLCEPLTKEEKFELDDLRRELIAYFDLDIDGLYRSDEYPNTTMEWKDTIEIDWTDDDLG